jgi:membrane protease YdiL (CAAX protease family)
MATLHEPPVATPPDADPDAAPPFPWYAPFLTGLAVFLGAGIVVAIIGVAAGWNANNLPDRAVLLATLGQDLALIGGVFAVARLTSRRPRWDLGLRRHVRVGRSLLLAFVAFVAFFGFLLVWQAVLDIKQTDDLAQQLGARDSSFNLAFVAVLVAVIAPIAEELFFRGFLFGALRGVMHWVPAAIVTGISFGLVHAGGTDAVFLVPLAVLGFLLCLLYRRTGSLLPGMGVHAFNNALALAATLHWTAGQGIVAVIAAPALTVAIAAAVSVSAPSRPSAPAPMVAPQWLPPRAP